MPECKVTIIIPVKPGGEVKAVTRLQLLGVLTPLTEVLVTEGTQPSSQRNRAAARAEGDIIYFLDDDSLLHEGNITRLMQYFSDPRVGVVGGPSLTPAEDGVWQRTFGCALSSPFGGGGVCNRYRQWGGLRETDETELILCNLAMRRDLFQDLGGFDERLYPNEENELLERVKQKGLKMLHDPQLAVYRSQRATLRQFIRQLFTYGRGRAEQSILTRRIKMVALLPAIFLVYLVTVPLIDYPVYYLPLLCYAIAVCLALCEGWTRHRDLAVTSLLPVVLPTLHLSYGAGLVVGFLTPRFRTRNSRNGEIVVKKLW